MLKKRLLRVIVAITALAGFSLATQQTHSRTAEAALDCYDINGDGYVDAVDAQIDFSYYVLSSPEVLTADVTGDGYVNKSDPESFFAHINTETTCQTAPVGHVNDTSLSFGVAGTSSGVVPWSWFVAFPLSSDGTTHVVSGTDPGLGAGSPASAFAGAFASDVNAAGWPGLTASSSGATFSIMLNKTAAGAAGGFVFGIGDLLSTHCVVTTTMTAKQGGCSFNPTISAVPVPPVGGASSEPDRAALASATTTSGHTRMMSLVSSAVSVAILAAGLGWYLRRKPGHKPEA